MSRTPAFQGVYHHNGWHVHLAPHLLVRNAPDTISPLCCLMRRCGLVVYLRKGAEESREA